MVGVRTQGRYHVDASRAALADSHFDVLGYQFKRSQRGKMMRLIRPKSLRKLRKTIKSRTRRNNGKSMEAIVADPNRTLPGRFSPFSLLSNNLPHQFVI